MTGPDLEALAQHPLFQRIERVRRHRGKVRGELITLAHGGGGKAMRDLIEDVFISAFGNPALDRMEDQAQIDLGHLAAAGDRLAFTTDSYVVDPLFFRGGDIGTLAVNGTVNDLAVGGATPLYLSCGFILEEGFPIADLRRIAASMAQAAATARVAIVAGDTKVVHRGAVDKVFVNTAGVGVVRRGVAISAENATPGDVVIVSGPLGEHGVAVLAARGDLALDVGIGSDCCSLANLCAAVLDACPAVRCMRDLTRGGLAAALNEIALASEAGIAIAERALPLRREVVSTCELLGLDPLYLANEGTLVLIAPAEAADAIIVAMRAVPAGRAATVIGRVAAEPAGVVLLETSLGGTRIVDMLVGEQLPRIC
jgi:hydrogenase expression/formation protein HypE